MSEQAIQEAYYQEQQRYIDAITKIQALTRGILGRAKYKKLLPLLRRRKQVRLLCAECDKTVAIKICRNCKDKFCEECYTKLHRKGNFFI